MSERACARCGTAFVPRRGGRPQLFCSRQCGWRSLNAARYSRNRDAVLIHQRTTHYGLSTADYERLRDEQRGVCAICGQPETSRRGGRLRTLSVDHDHATGRLRGLLCNRCNRALGGFDDSPELLLAAAAYLSRHRLEVAP